MQSAGLESRKGIADGRHERRKVRDTVRWGTDKKYPERQSGEILLELDALVHRDQRVVFAAHALQEFAVRDASPATADDGIDTVALERLGEVYRKLLVKKNAHQPAA